MRASPTRLSTTVTSKEPTIVETTLGVPSGIGTERLPYTDTAIGNVGGGATAGVHAADRIVAAINVTSVLFMVVTVLCR
jgi:hypothetical protein